jgi:hypothetical protein
MSEGRDAGQGRCRMLIRVVSCPLAAARAPTRGAQLFQRGNVAHRSDACVAFTPRLGAPSMSLQSCPKKQQVRAELERLCAPYDGEIVRDARAGQRVQVRCGCCNLAYRAVRRIAPFAARCIVGVADRTAWRSRGDFQFAAGHLDAVQRTVLGVLSRLALQL